jgi:vacuolar-type H+-ATPase subunit I/STV1
VDLATVLAASDLTFPGWLGALGLLTVLAGSAAVVWSKFRADASDLTMTRLRSENEDYLRRLNYLEPRVTALESRNKVLEELHDPAEEIAALRKEEAAHHTEQMRVLRSIDKHVQREAP